jgi:hypothetical protein
MDQYNTVYKNGDTRRTKVRHARAFPSILCTNHAIGTSGGKDELECGKRTFTIAFCI